MNQQQIIKKQVRTILMDYPGFSNILLWSPLIIDERVEVSGTDGSAIYFGKDFFKLKESQMNAVIVHELIHIALQHCKRDSSTNKQIWNIAADIVVNKAIQDSIQEYQLPKDALDISHFNKLVGFQDAIYSVKGMNVEQLYELLAKHKNNPNVLDLDPKDLLPEPSNKMAEVNKSEQQARFNKLFSDKTVSEIFQSILPTPKTKTNWKKILKAKIKKNILSNNFVVNYERPTRRIGTYKNTFIPHRKLDDNICTIGVVIDTSGSINEELLLQFIAEVSKIQSQMKSNIRLLYADCKIQSQYFIPHKKNFLKEYKKGSIPPKGRGGTDFRPAVELLNKIKCSPIVYFTDGYGDFPQTSKSKIIWAMTQRHTNISVGEIIWLNE